MVTLCHQQGTFYHLIISPGNAKTNAFILLIRPRDDNNPVHCIQSTSDCPVSRVMQSRVPLLVSKRDVPKVPLKKSTLHLIVRR